jgi:ribonuclease-3
LIFESALTELESTLGHAFRSPDLLVRALTHRSLTRQIAQDAGKEESAAAEDNERLEFLGDAVLNLIVAEALFNLHPEWQEGELTRVRSRLVSREHMAQVAKTIELGNHLRLNKAEERSGLRRTSTVLSNSMEAVLGALFLDGGLEPVRAFTRTHVIGDEVKLLAEEIRTGAALGNFKSALQEKLQAERVGTPLYRVKSESGPAHRRKFLVEVRLTTEAGERTQLLARGTGRSKKTAEQDAARRALENLADLTGRGDVEEEQTKSASK